MISRPMPIRLLACAAALVLLAGVGAANAQQRSIQLEVDITKTFEAVEKNKVGFDAAVGPARKRLEELAKRSAEITQAMSAIPGNIPDEQKPQRRRELHAEAVQVHAEFLKQASTVIGEASKLIAGNMTALDSLSRRLETNGQAAANPKQMLARIEAQAEVGRQIMREVRAIHNLASKDPSLARRVNSLMNTAAAIDRSITAQKMRMKANEADGLAADHSRVVGMINMAVGEMADMYTSLEADKALLGEFKEEVELAVNMGLLDLTREIVHRSLPVLNDPSSDSVVPGLSNMISSMRDQNRGALNENKVAPKMADGKGNAPVQVPEIPRFKNF